MGLEAIYINKAPRQAEGQVVDLDTAIPHPSIPDSVVFRGHDEIGSTVALSWFNG